MKGMTAWTILTLAALSHAIYVLSTINRYADDLAALQANSAGLVLAIYATSVGIFGLLYLRPAVGTRLLHRLSNLRFWRLVLYLGAAALLLALSLGGWMVAAKEVFRAALVGGVLVVLWTTARSTTGEPPETSGAGKRRLDLLLTNLFVTVVLLELGLRGLALTSDSPLFMRFEANNKLERSLRPGQVRMGFASNDRGFYDTEFREEKPEGAVRIVALGDSFAAGIVPYRRNSLTLLEENLAAGHEGVEVYNMGVNGIDVGDYRYLYLTEGHRYQPDAVLILFYLGNDFGSTALPGPLDRNFWYLWFVPNRIIAIGREAARRGVGISEVGAEKEEDYEEEPYHADPDLEPPSYSLETYIQIERNQLKFFRKNGARKRREDRTLGALADIVRAARSAGAQPTLVIIPAEFQVDDDQYVQLIAHSGIDPDDFDLAEPGRRLTEFCADHEVPCLDLTPALRAAHAKGHRVYHRRDMHWNATGNRVAAAAMTEFLNREILHPDK